MRSIDLSPLYRASVGFDRLFKTLDQVNRLEDSAFSYPPYNIAAVDENQYQVTMAVAGFAEDDIEITTEQNVLSVSGQRADENDDAKYLHRGIATRSFERRFNLADHVRVTGAEMENGLLHIYLEREIPEAMKPRKIEIQPARRLLDVEKREEKAA